MCNPRRVTIEVNRTVEEAWQTTVEQVAEVRDEVEEEGRLRLDIPLDAEMGDRALAMLERLLAGEFEDYEAWERGGDGNFRRDLDDVTVVYQPGSRQLLVETRLGEQVTAEARAEAEAGGFTVGEVAVEAVGRYYSDGWGGRTEERARGMAEEEAERKLASATEELHRQQHAAELEAAEAQARAEAERRAEEELERLRGEMREALRGRIQAVLAGARERVQHTLNRLVGEAYRRTLIQLVHDNGGRLVHDRRTGSVIDLELEIY